MKNYIRYFIVLACLALPAPDVSAQIFVRVRPARPKVVVVRPEAPSPRHVWVDEDWVPEGRTYHWHGGYWAAPPREGVVWVPGHWSRKKRGHVWIAGHWR